MTTEKEKSLQAVLDKTVDGKKVFGTSFAIKKDAWVWRGAAGNLASDQPYFIASTTKLFTTAIILKLKAAGKLSLDDNISQYLSLPILSGLHVFHGKDYAQALTIKQLLAHTSGLPDYFQGKGTNGKSLENELMEGNDQSWTFEQAMERTKDMAPLFAPGTNRKAKYSDANFQLLGKIIEAITQRSYAENCHAFIMEPLGLAHTYLYQDPADQTPQKLYFKAQELHIPKAMASFGPDGGIVSTSADMLVFIEAFFQAGYSPRPTSTHCKIGTVFFSRCGPALASIYSNCLGFLTLPARYRPSLGTPGFPGPWPITAQKRACTSREPSTK